MLRRDRRLGEGKRARVHVCRAAEGVAGELVEQDQERKRALGRLHPVVVRARRGLEVQRHETIAEQLIERVVAAESALAPGVAPERHHASRRLGHPDPPAPSCAPGAA
jgi:dihydroxyacetone kinase